MPLRLVCTATVSGTAREIQMEEQMFREPLTKKCAPRLKAGPPCGGDGSHIASYLYCFAWHRIQRSAGLFDSYTTREALLDGLSEAGRVYHRTCKVNVRRLSRHNL